MYSVKFHSVLKEDPAVLELVITDPSTLQPAIIGKRLGAAIEEVVTSRII